MIKQAISHSVRLCPICGRPVEILPEHHGTRVTCGHCRGQFVSEDSHEARDKFERKVNETLARADRFLARMANFIQVEELLEYENDMNTLSDAVLGCLAGKPLVERAVRERVGQNR